MKLKEIHALRKEGRVEEAFAAAEQEYALSANIYTASALFWCLNDTFRDQDPRESAASVERMEKLVALHGSDDDLMQRTLARAQKRVSPQWRAVKQARESSRRGEDISPLYAEIAAWHEAGVLDEMLYQDFGWLTYHMLKNAPAADTKLRKQLLNNYLKLDLPRPSALHSRMLGEAVKIENDAPYQFRIRDFIRLWGIDNLRDEDWEPFRTSGGRVLPSLVEKLVGAYARELKGDRAQAAEEFSRLVDKALEQYPSNQHLPYFKAIVLMSQGRQQEALEYYKSLILRYPSKSYLWRQAAELADDVDTRIALLCRALQCGADEEFLGGVRLRLAYLLDECNLSGAARYELERYRDTYQRKGWKLRWDFHKLYRRVQSAPLPDSNAALYAQFGVRADEFLYSALPMLQGVKISERIFDDSYHPGRKVMCWTLRVGNAMVRVRKPGRFKVAAAPNGTLFDLRMQGDKVVWMRPHQG